jgi:hypothetical protein
MKPNLSAMTNAELKQYISEHRNDQEAFQAALEVLMSRRNPANLQPSPFKFADPQHEVEALFRDRLRNIQQQDSDTDRLK